MKTTPPVLKNQSSGRIRRCAQFAALLLGLVLLSAWDVAPWPRQAPEEPAAATSSSGLLADRQSPPSHGQAPGHALTLSRVAAASDLIVRGRVGASTARWTDDGAMIVTDVAVEPLYALLGTPPPDLVVTLPGGILADQAIAMASAPAAKLPTDAHVLLFLRHGRLGYEVVRAEQGVYVVGEGQIDNPTSGVFAPLPDFYAQLLRADAKGVIGVPGNWQELEASADAQFPVRAQDYVFSERSWPGGNPVIDYVVNLNSGYIDNGGGTEAEFLTAITRAADTWGAVGSSAFALRYSGATDATAIGFNGVNEVLFTSDVPDQLVGLARFWFNPETGIILEADIGVNENYRLDATGNPELDEVDLESIMLHEFGHWLSLDHATDAEAIMYARLVSGTLRRELGTSDLAGIAHIYPCSAEPCLPAWITPAPTTPPTPTATPVPPTPTSTPSPTPSPTLTPTLTPTPTAVPGGTIPDPQATTTLITPAPSTPTATEALSNELLLEPGTTVQKTIVDGTSSVEIDAPADAVTAPVTIHFQRIAEPQPSTDPSLGHVGYAFLLSAMREGSELDGFVFDNALAIQIPSEELTDVDHINDVVLMRFDDAAGLWRATDCSGQSLQLVDDNVTALICRTGTFALFTPDTPAPATRRVYLPFVLNR